MSLQVETNPADFESRYLACLNQCFGHWGDEAMYAWAFTRTAGSAPTDQMVLTDDHDEVLAGSAVSYRQVRGGERMFDVGIMTGSWTLPAARGQGCFTRIVEESRKLSAQHGCAVLLAFVTWDNASRRRLESAGSLMIPSRYIFTSDDEEPSATLPVAPANLDEATLWQRIERSRGDRLHITYPTLEDFVGQCLHRPHPVDACAVGDACVLIERTPGTDRVVVADLGGESAAEVYRTLAAVAADEDRRFFAFAMGEQEFGGLAYKEGFLTVLGADDSPLDGIAVDDLRDWHIDSGDRM